MRRIALCLFTALLLSACASGMKAVKHNAPKDFNCSMDKLEFIENSENNYTVKGCGKQGNYVYENGVAKLQGGVIVTAE